MSGIVFRPLPVRGRGGRIDLQKVRSYSADTKRPALAFLAKEAESAQRFLDMFLIVSELLRCIDDLNEFMSEEERRMVAVACKNVTGQYRAAWRAVRVESTARQGTAIAEAYKEHIKEELVSHCRAVLELFNRTRSRGADNNTVISDESRAFVQKMISDYHRYIAEVMPDNDTSELISQYRLGMEMALRLEPMHPIRLGLALNYSVCLYEIVHDAAAASQMAKDAFDAAIAQLDYIEENFYKDSTLIMQLLRDNITQWSSDGH